MDSVPQKRCTKCKKEFSATNEYFHRQAKGLYGLNAQCKNCVRAYDALPERKAKRKANDKTEVAKERARQRRQNPDYRAKEKLRYLRRKPQIAEYCKTERWKAIARKSKSRPEHKRRVKENNEKRRQDPEYVKGERERDKIRRQRPGFKEYNRVKSSSRRARVAQVGGTHSAEDVALQLKTQKGKCWWCGKKIRGKYHVDHRIPLSRGGTHWPNNICISCPKCNMSKGAKYPHEWIGRLL